MPSPVDETYRPSRMSLSRAIPGPRSVTRATSSAAALAFTSELDAATTGILVRVAGDLRHRGREARLVLPIELELGRELTCALAGEHDVVLAHELHGQQRRQRHPVSSRRARRFR